MSAILLYLLTLLLETLSVASRALLVSALVRPFLDTQASLAVASVAALGPLFYSLAVLGGLPSGHGMVRWRLKARLPDPQESRAIDAALERLVQRGAASVPRRVFVVDRQDLNAAVSGTTLYVHVGLIESGYLVPVLAHELGHLSSGDGRLILALHGLVLPGAYWIGGALIGLLIVLFKGLALLFMLLCGLVGIRSRFIYRVFTFVAGALPRYIIIFAMGGAGPKLLAFAWERYFIGREYQADAYAARLGYGHENIELLEIYAQALADIEIPWSSNRTHPPDGARIARLRQAIAGPQQQTKPVPSSHNVAPRQLDWRSALIYGGLALLVGLGIWAAATPARWLNAPLPTRPAGPTPTIDLILRLEELPQP